MDEDQHEVSAFVVAGSAIVALVAALGVLATMEVALEVAVGSGLIAASLGAVLGGLITGRM